MIIVHDKLTFSFGNDTGSDPKHFVNTAPHDEHTFVLF